MFHVTSVLPAWLARRYRARTARDHHTAAAYGWQVEQVAPGTYRYRDPRFDTVRRPS